MFQTSRSRKSWSSFGPLAHVLLTCTSPYFHFDKIHFLLHLHLFTIYDIFALSLGFINSAGISFLDAPISYSPLQGYFVPTRLSNKQRERELDSGSNTFKLPCIPLNPNCFLSSNIYGVLTSLPTPPNNPFSQLLSATQTFGNWNHRETLRAASLCFCPLLTSYLLVIGPLIRIHDPTKVSVICYSQNRNFTPRAIHVSLKFEKVSSERLSY